MPLSLVFAVIATVLNSIAGLMQSNATRHVTRHRSLATQPWYIAGLVLDGCGWVCTVLALRHLPVFVVQAVQGGAIALTAIGARMIWGSSLRTIDRVAVGVCVTGLVLVSASAGSGRPATADVGVDVGAGSDVRRPGGGAAGTALERTRVAAGCGGRTGVRRYVARRPGRRRPRWGTALSRRCSPSPPPTSSPPSGSSG